MQESEGLKNAKPAVAIRLNSDAGTILTDDANELAIATSTDTREVNNVEEMKLFKNEMEDDLRKEFEELKSKVDALGSKLVEVCLLCPCV